MWFLDKFIPGLMVLGVCLALGAPCAAADDPAAILRRGEIAFNRGDLGEAIARYREAAMLGHAPAMVRLAYVLDRAEENQEALRWYRQAAELGDAQGQFGLGQMLSNGEGVEKDPVQGLMWIRRAADQGLLPAIVASARLLEEGKPPSVRDPALAFQMWQRAAELGEHGAMRRLVQIFRGAQLGQAADEVQAAAWEARLARATGQSLPPRKK